MLAQETFPSMFFNFECLFGTGHIFYSIAKVMKFPGRCSIDKSCLYVMKLRPRCRKFSLFYFTSQSRNTSLDFLCVKLYLRCTFFCFVTLTWNAPESSQSFSALGLNSSVSSLNTSNCERYSFRRIYAIMIH